MNPRQNSMNNSVNLSPAGKISLRVGKGAVYSYAAAGDKFFKEKEYFEASEMYRKAHDIVALPQFLVNRGLCQVELHDYDAALENFSNAIFRFEQLHSKGGEYASVLAYRADTLKRVGQFDAAIRYFRRALDVDPRADDIWVSLGNIYYGLRQYSEALKCFKKALALVPDDIEVLSNALLTCHRMKNETLARHYNELISNLNSQDRPTLDTQKELSDSATKVKLLSTKRQLFKSDSDDEKENEKSPRLAKKAKISISKRSQKKPMNDKEEESSKIAKKTQPLISRRRIEDPESDEELEKVAEPTKQANKPKLTSKRIINDPESEVEFIAPRDFKKPRLIQSPQIKPANPYNDDWLIDDECLPSSNAIYQKVTSAPVEREKVDKQVTFAPQLAPIQAAETIALKRIEASQSLDDKDKYEMLGDAKSYFKKINPSQTSTGMKYTTAADTMLGLWGEESYYQLFLFKYSLIAKKITFNDDGFTAEIEKEVNDKDGSVKIEKKNVKVWFPNVKKYDSYTDKRPPSAFGSVGKDLVREKTYSDKTPKIDYFEVKTTAKSKKQASIISMSAEENFLMSTNQLAEKGKKTNTTYSWNLIRFFSAGSKDADYTRLKKIEPANLQPKKFKM